VDATKELLRRLAASDERSIRDVLSGRCQQGDGLDRIARALVQLAAMLAVDAPTTSVRWAVDVASTAGVDDAALVRVLVSAASATGAAQTVASALRLALAVGVDLEVDGEQVRRQTARKVWEARGWATVACVYEERASDGSWKPAKLALLRFRRAQDAWKRQAALTLAGDDALALADAITGWRDLIDREPPR